ncbi:MAG: hypothetical protein JNN03_11045 [Rubrivivax sp.]|nr:hypothetical protein [Rubrivivax sp.]
MQTKMIAAATLMVLATAAQAQGYVGAAAGVTKLNDSCAGTVTCDTTGSGFKVYGGYKFMPFLGAELVHFNFGKAKATSLVGATTVAVEIEPGGFGLGVAATTDLAANVPATARLGVASIKTKSSGSAQGVSVSSSESSTQAYFGLDIGYAFSKSLAASLSADFSRAKTSGETAAVRLVGAGIRFAF